MPIKYWESMSARENAAQEKKREASVIRLETIGTPDDGKAVVMNTAEPVTDTFTTAEPVTIVSAARPDARPPRFIACIALVLSYIGITLLTVIAVVAGVLCVAAAAASCGLGGAIVSQGIVNLSNSTLIAFEFTGLGIVLVAAGLLFAAGFLKLFSGAVPGSARLYKKTCKALF